MLMCNLHTYSLTFDVKFSICLCQNYTLQFFNSHEINVVRIFILQAIGDLHIE